MPPKSELYDLYINQRKNFVAIGKLYGVSNVTIKNWCSKYGIKQRPHSEAIKLTAKRQLLDIKSSEYTEEKLSILQIAKRHNTSTVTVRKRLLEQGVIFRSSKEGNRLIDRTKFFFSKELAMKYNAGASLNDLAKEYQTSRSTIGAYLKKMGVTLRNKKATSKLAIEKGINTKINLYGYMYYPDIRTSKAENEIREYLHFLGFNFQTDRTTLGGLELDGYDPSIQVAFEYCGLYWHSEREKDFRYHHNKMRLCQEKGIRLFTIFEDEWRDRKEQIKEFLRSSLGIYDVRYHARKLQVKEITKIEAIRFCEQYHIQGSTPHINIAIGLYKEHELIGCMTFGLHHRGKNEMVLNRLCFRTGDQIIGGASRLLSYARKIIKVPIKSWSDNRWSLGIVYEKMGFKLIEEHAPDYSYTNYEIRRSKQSMKKSATGCPLDLTEHKWCNQNGWYRIYDCGKKTWIVDK